MSTESIVLNLHAHQTLERRCIRRDSPYRTVIAIGAIRSGKTLTLALYFIDRGQWDTSQYHGLFANTGPQLHGAILDEVLPWLELAGIESTWNTRPPKEWIERWRIEGIKVPPPRKKYTNILIFSTGLHIYCGSMTNRSYRQVKGMKFGSIVIEEVTAGATEEGLRYLFERVNCGIGPAKCKLLHHHLKLIHGNVPDEDGHWIYDWMARAEARVAKSLGKEQSGNADEYPCLLHGLGDTIYIPSRTVDNVDNLPADFIDDMTGNVDEDTANRVLKGIMTRRRVGRAYNGYDRDNLFPIKYDPDRMLYLFLDFNINPAVCGFAHPLLVGEYPPEYHVPGDSYEGVFGEFFHIGGMDVHQMAVEISRGSDVGSNGYMPRNWKGLGAHRGKVIAFGDAKGGAKRTVTGFTPWSIVNEVFREACTDVEPRRCRYSVNVGTENPLQQIRIRSLNARFCSAKKTRRLFIDPNVHELQIDLETVITAPDGTIVKPGGPRPGSKFWHRTHISDGLGYMECTLHPMGREISTRPEDYIPRTGSAPRTPPRTSI